MKRSNQYLKALLEAAKARARQIHLQVGHPVRYRIRHEFINAEEDTPLDINGWTDLLGCGPSSEKRFDAMVLKTIGGRRFKVRITFGDGDTLPYAVLTPLLEIKNAPNFSALHDPLMSRTGLILISGPPMSGRTTMAMQMLDFVRQNRTGSIGTGELITEHLLVGDDIFRTNFDFPIDAIECLAADGHDIVYIESIPDAATFDAVLNAAEDRLVIASWNSSSLARTLEGLVYDYSDNSTNTRRLCHRVADVFRAFIGTELIPTNPNSRYGRRYGRILAREMAIANDTANQHIREGNFHLLNGATTDTSGPLILPFNADLRQLLDYGAIDSDTAKAFEHQAPAAPKIIIEHA